MRRPSGVVVSCIVLGFIALMLLMSAMSSLFMLAIAGSIPIPVHPGQPAADPAMVTGIMRVTFIILGLVYAALATWAIITIVGLVRMKNWARYSILVIGGGLAVMGIMLAIGSIFVQMVAPSMPQQPGQNPALVHMMMLFMAVAFLAIAAVGIWWLVYFSMRRTREAFAQAAPPQAVVAYAPSPSPYAASTYEVASYLPEPLAEPIPTPYVELPPPTPPGRPLAISIIAWLLIAGGAICLPFLFFNFPIFLAGIILTGLPAHLTMISFAIISILAGIGLLRLEKIALYVASAFYLFGIFNTSLLLLPSVRDRMIVYQQDLVQKMSFGVPQPVIFDNHTMALLLLPGIFFGAIFCIAILVLLYLNRAAFNRDPQAAA